MLIRLTKDEVATIVSDHFSKLYGYGPSKSCKITPYGDFIAEVQVDVTPERYVMPPTLIDKISVVEAPKTEVNPLVPETWPKQKENNGSA